MNKYTTNAIDSSILSVLDIVSDGKVVSAERWNTLWNTVFTHINNIDAYCVDLEELRQNWTDSEEKLNKSLEDVNAKYNALKESFIHYGKEAPTDPAIRLWVEPVEDVDDSATVSHKELNDALADKVVAFEPINPTSDADAYLTVSLNNAIALEYNSSYLIERFRVKQDLKGVRVSYPGGFGTNTEKLVIPIDTNITVIHTRNSGGYVDGSYNITTFVSFDSPILSTPTYGKDGLCLGYYTITAFVNAAGEVKDVKITFYENANTTMLKEAIKISNVTLEAGKWILDNATGAYVQQVSVGNITYNTLVDISLTVSQIVTFKQKDITFIPVNDNKVIKVYCVGQKPTQDYTVQMKFTEVKTI